MSFLAAGLAGSEHLTRWAERGLFGDEVIFATTTPYQRLVVTRWKDDTALPSAATCSSPAATNTATTGAGASGAADHAVGAAVLVLGGGDGLRCARSCATQCRRVALVDLDPAMTDLFSRNPDLVGLNGGSPSRSAGHEWSTPTPASGSTPTPGVRPDRRRLSPTRPASVSANSTRCRSTG